jgi:hypothetical protein
MHLPVREGQLATLQGQPVARPISKLSLVYSAPYAVRHLFILASACLNPGSPSTIARDCMTLYSSLDVFLSWIVLVLRGVTSYKVVTERNWEF